MPSCAVVVIGLGVLGATSARSSDPAVDVTADEETSPREPPEPGTSSTERINAKLLDGVLVDGRPWALSTDEAGKFCLEFDQRPLGCTASLRPNEDQPKGQPNSAASFDGVSELPADEAIQLVYGELPDGATTVAIVLEGGAVLDDGLVINYAARVWAIPTEPGTAPWTVRYLDDEGRLVIELPGAG